MPTPTAWACGIVTARTTRVASNKGGNINPDKLYKPTPQMERRVKSKAAVLAYEEKHLTMVTLTCKDHIEDNEPVKLFLDNMVKQKVIKRYLWVRERQKRGANHWHILVACYTGYVDLMKIRSAWVSARMTFGYDPCPYAFQVGFKDKKTGKKTLWSRNAVMVANYLAKYITKGYRNTVAKNIGKPVQSVIRQNVTADVKGYRVEVKYGEVTRITDSSQIKYKFSVELESCIHGQPPIPNVINSGVNCLTYYFNPTLKFMRWLNFAANMHEYLNKQREEFHNYYRNANT